ncbi:DUF4113 domain-containing protein [Pseudomonas sp. TH35]|nr:DUF4113 domain-containing protein [Pseudomonas sp. TH71]MBK5367726.1 DUF4113 domain-containing protein [Pseudomonas sp. TH40]MBK5378895.1 DUF4113 domain-containing protein [Pseudomonas sp. TH35]MBK5384354.1 DUF4113 domain-containing protein [Pseudomonas sp. TH38]MBK5401649.1 DUF4113 domain-containing protein [Pseudomonas sp. TH37]MBK5463747.1 DUF4113 domain-containing protein [Pseudomonas sp. TH20]MBK5520026.1 DUF4113 domain-containing protein [Pseudomonas sp. TH09]
MPRGSAEPLRSVRDHAHRARRFAWWQGHRLEATRVMAVLDQINGRWGRGGTLRAASAPTNPDRGMQREMMSQSYTTRLDQLWTVSCR